MGRPARGHLTALLAVAVVAAAGIGAAVAIDAPDRTLVVADADDGERVLETPVERGETVTLAYTHSVEKTPVRDVYVVDGAELRMVRTEFDSFGAGLPADADVERTDDGLVASVNRSYERVRVVPGSIAGHELVVGEARHDLVALADGGSGSDDGEGVGTDGGGDGPGESGGDGPGVVLFVEERSATDALERLAREVPR